MASHIIKKACVCVCEMHVVLLSKNAIYTYLFWWFCVIIMYRRTLHKDICRKPWYLLFYLSIWILFIIIIPCSSLLQMHYSGLSWILIWFDFKVLAWDYRFLHIIIMHFLHTWAPEYTHGWLVFLSSCRYLLGFRAADLLTAERPLFRSTHLEGPRFCFLKTVHGKWEG